MKSRNRIIRTRGFTIIEVMITLSITSVLVLGASAFLASANQTNRVQQAVSGMNSDGRSGLERIARDVRMSGYRDSNWTLGPLATVIVATNGLAIDGGDILGVTYEGSRDCNFELEPTGVVSNSYRVVDGNLECNDEPIAGGVQEMQIYFGEDTDNDDVANRWLSPNDVGLDMTRVVSVRVHLLLRTNDNDISSGAQAYYFNNAQQPAIDDGQIRREYSVTIALRNPT